MAHSRRLLQVLGVRAPIILPGMSYVSTPRLVAAVSNAGGLGILASGPLSCDETRAAIRRVRELTDKPFGVGCTLLMPGAKENVDVALEERVPVLNYSLGKGDWIVRRAKEYGGRVVATVASVRHAVAAERQGCDALIVTGNEAAAHGGPVSSLVLVPAVANAVNLPLIAAGGVADGRGLAAAVALGAEGVAMGSRLAVSAESPLPDNVKREIVRRGGEETIYSKNFDGLFARVMDTAAARRATKRPTPAPVAGVLAAPLVKCLSDSFDEKRIVAARAAVRGAAAAWRMGVPFWSTLRGVFTEFERMWLLAHFGAIKPKIVAATVAGDLERGVQFVGSSQGLICDEASVEEIVNRTMAEAKAAGRRLADMDFA